MSGGEYLALAYLVVFAAVLVYVVIIAAKLARLERETAELVRLARERREAPEREAAAVGWAPHLAGAGGLRRGRARVRR